jgi:IPT/TIG domain-containing protein
LKNIDPILSNYKKKKNKQTTKLLSSLSVIFAFIMVIGCLTLTEQTTPNESSWSASEPTRSSSSVIVSSATPVTTSGGLTTIIGSGFGNDPLLVTVSIAGQPCTNVGIIVSDTQLQCTVPSGSGKELYVIVVANGTASAPVPIFNYISPTIGNMNPSTVPTAGANITITGTNFGADASVVSVELGGKSCNNVTITTPHTEISCVAPAGTGANQNLIVTVNQQQSNQKIVNYTAPSITSVNPTNISTQGGIISINGTNFGSDPGAISVKLDQVPCTGITIVSPTSLHVLAPTGTGANHSIQVTVDGQLSNLLSLNYSVPIIYTVSPSNLSTGGGTGIIVEGTNFGTDPGVITLKVGSWDCTNISISRSHEQITAIAPVGYGTALSLILNVSNQFSAPFNIDYGAPVISSINVSTIPTTGCSIYLTGENFDTDFSLTIGGESCITDSIGQDHRSANVTVPAGVGLNLAVQMTTVHGRVSNIIYVNRAAPTIISVNTTIVSATGGSIKVNGTNFGSDIPSLTARLNGIDVSSGISFSILHNQVVIILPAGAGTSLPLTIEVAGQLSNSIIISRSAPVITQINESSIPTNGATVLINGSGFGSDAGAITVELNGQSCTSVMISSPNNQISALLPSGTGRNVVLVVTVDGQPSNNFLVDYKAPTILDVNDTSLPTVGGQVTIEGTNFGDDINQISALLDGIPCDNYIISINHSQIICDLPAGIGQSRSLSIIVNGQMSNSYITDYDAPVILSSQSLSDTMPTAGGGIIKITGNNFGTDPTDITITIGGRSCTSFWISQPHTEITAIVPPGEGLSQQILITVSGQVSQEFIFVEYNEPVIYSISPNNDWPTAGGTPITLIGVNFGTPSATLTLTVAGGGISITGNNQTHINFTLPAGTGCDITIMVAVSGQDTTLFCAGSYASPTITATNISTTPVPGLWISIEGSYFGNTKDYISVTCGGLACEEIDLITVDSKIKCKLPSGASFLDKTTHPLIVTVDSQQTNIYNIYVHGAPTIDQVMPTDIPTGGGKVSVNGTNFGSDVSRLSVTLGGTACTNIVIEISDSIISFTAPSGSGSKTLNITVDGQSVTQSVSYGSSAPIITSLDVSSIPTAGGTIEIEGMNFGSSIGAVLVTYDGVPCTDVTFITPGFSISCTVPAGTGTNRPLVVNVSGWNSDAFYVSRSNPWVNVSQLEPIPTNTSIYAISINGTNFGTDPSLVSILYDGYTLTDANFTIYTLHTQLIIYAPSGTGGSVEVKITVDGLDSQVFYISRRYPDIYWVNASTLPTSEATLIIDGKNFGNDTDEIKVTLAGVLCTEITLLVLHDTISCKIPAGYAGSVNLVVEIAGQSVYLTLDREAEYLAPVITNATPGIIPTAGGSLTITGYNFGTNASIVSVTLGGLLCTGLGVSDTQITCTVPAGTGTNLQLIVTVNGISDTFGSFSRTAPSITSISGAPVLTTGGSITIDGLNFGNNASSIIVMMEIYFIDSSGQACTSIAVVTPHTRISCTVPVGTGYDLAVWVIVDGQESNSYNIDRTLPSITSISIPTIPTTGGNFAINGTNFGTGSSLITVLLNGIPCTNLVMDTAHSRIICTAPTGTGTNIPLNIIVDGQVSLSYLIDRTVPTITSINIPTIPTYGGTIVINGSNFGSIATDISVLLGGVACTNVIMDTVHSRIVCTAPVGTGINIELNLTVSGQQSLSYLINRTAPTITSLNVTILPTTGGSILITGSNFGNNSGVISITVDGQPCTSIEISTNHQQITCTAPIGTGTNNQLIMIVDTLTSNTISFSRSLPTISAINTTTIPTIGCIIAINGTNFGTILGTISVSFDGQPCTDISISIAHQQIVCTVLAGIGTLKQLVVVVNSQISNGLSVSRTSPVLTAVNTTIIPTAGGVIKINGTNFGTNAGSISVLYDGQACTGITISISHQQITCSLPAGTGTLKQIVVIVDGQQTNHISVSRTGPNIVSTGISTIPTTGGVLSITGTDFGTDVNLISVSYGGIPCQNVILTTAGSGITVIVPSGVGTNVPLIVTVDGQFSTSYPISRVAPTITSVSPGQLQTTSTLIIIQGNNFGTSSDSVSVTVGGIQCTGVIISSSHQQVTCTVPEGVTSNLAVIITVAGQPSNSYLINRCSPRIDLVNVTVLPTVSTTISIQGTNFGNDLPSIQVTFGGESCTNIIILVAHSQITCTVPQGTGINHPLVLWVGSRASNSFYLSRQNPSINSLNLTIIPKIAVSISINGSNFGSNVGLISVTLNGVPCTGITLSIAQMEITCTLPAGSGSSIPLVVTVDGQSSAAYYLTRPGSPSVISTNISILPTSTCPITINGNNFGTNISEISVFLDGELCTGITLTVPHQQITCLLPAGTSDKITLVIVVSGEGTEPIIMYRAAPTINNFNITSMTTAGGGIAIDGTNLSNNASAVSVLFGGTLCTDISINIAHQQVSCLIPTGITGGFLVIVVNGKTSNAIYLSRAAPTINSTNVTIMPTSGGSIQISGMNFGNDVNVVSVMFDGLLCTNLSIDIAHEQLTCTIPSGIGDNKSLVVVINGLQSNQYILSYQHVDVIKPKVNLINPTNDTDGIIYIHWDIVLGAQYYYVYRSISPINSTHNIQHIAKVTSNLFKDNVTTNGTYYYSIVAYDSFGHSQISDNVKITVGISSFVDPQTEEPQGNDEPINPILLAGIFAIIGLFAIVLTWALTKAGIKKDGASINPGDVKRNISPSDKKSIEKKPSVTKPSAKKSVPSKRIEKKPSVTKPITKKSVSSKRIEKKPSVTKPITKKSVPSKRIEKKPSVTKPITKKSVPSKRIEKKPSVIKPITKKSEPSTPIEKKPSVTKPSAKKSVPSTPIEKKPSITKPNAKKSSMSKTTEEKPAAATPTKKKTTSTSKKKKSSVRKKKTKSSRKKKTTSSK